MENISSFSPNAAWSFSNSYNKTLIISEDSLLRLFNLQV